MSRLDGMAYNKFQLLNEKEFFQNQITWFEKQIKKIDIDNFEVSGISEKDNKVNEILKGSSVQEKHLNDLQRLLSDLGLKRLSNSLASAKKRKKSNKKSLQLMLEVETINKLEKLASAQSMTISEYLESL
ncbi:hypothetical protein [Vibrio splendidus]|uniref:hypothetical protein n=1 Tax=Vibrio splendidus TaxID=29497 RepID=UPI003D11AD48